MKQIKEIKSQIKDERFASAFFKDKFLNEKEDAKHSQEFIREQIVLIDLLLHAADSLANEVQPNSIAKFKYEQIKKSFGIK